MAGQGAGATCRVPRLQYSCTSQASWALAAASPSPLRLQALSLIWHSDCRSSSPSAQAPAAASSFAESLLSRSCARAGCTWHAQ